ncbi:MAG: co-chaperone YbbN [Rhodobacteraceae bacterium]|nr:co-chaperone YbbN [Paracoccaceae bacterium]
MLNLDNSSPKQVAIEGTEAQFNSEVVEASLTQPVIAYFTAQWCGPCKTMGPIIEQEVAKAKGKVQLVKYDVDKNRNLAAQLRIQSIPTIYAFFEGKPINGFAGAKTASEIGTFITELIKQSGGVTIDDKLEEAEEILDKGGVVEAMQIYGAVLQEFPDNAVAYAGMIRCHLTSNDLENADAMIEGIPESIAHSKEIESVKATIALRKQALDSGPISQLETKVATNPDDHQSRFDLAIALHSNGNVEGAVTELLELFRRDREWNEEAAKKQLLTIFDALKPENPIALKGRRKLSSLIFN